MKNNNKIFAVVAALFACSPVAASAAFRTGPISLPGRGYAQPVRLPSLPVSPVAFPSVSQQVAWTPRILPSLPQPIVGRRGISLPNLVNPFPVKRSVVVRSVAFAGAARLAGVPAEESSSTQDGEKLRRIYDNGRDSKRDDLASHGAPVTMPEDDLLNEIGVSASY